MRRNVELLSHMTFELWTMESNKNYSLQEFNQI